MRTMKFKNYENGWDWGIFVIHGLCGSVIGIVVGALSIFPFPQTLYNVACWAIILFIIAGFRGDFFWKNIKNLFSWHSW